jgi:protein-tyrosine phosphatase
MTCYKRLPLETLVNARDLGGFPTKDGRVTKYGVFIRSEVPKALSEGDLSFLRKYGVSLSLDFRGTQEIKNLPSKLEGLEDIKYLPCPMMNEDAAKASKREEHAPPPGGVSKSLFDINWVPVYTAILEAGKDWVRRVLTLAADWEGVVHYHCFTGKDRTGLFTALLLGLCGVDYNDIMWDYSLSMTCLRPFYEKMDTGILFTKEDGSPDFTRGFYCTSPETMFEVLGYLDKNYGGVEGYVRACGVETETIEKLRAKLTEEA